GRVVNFKNTIIILTSNLGSEIYTETSNQKEREEKIMERIKGFFKPEFLNRLDSIIVFNPLDEHMMDTIVDIQIHQVTERLGKQNLKLEMTNKLKDHLKHIGFDPVYGARPLKRI